MGNRPINRRPWRKKPWAKKVRPTRWNAAINSFSTEFPRIEPTLVPEGPNPQLPVLTLVSGQVDVEPWADDQEVTLDRTIGTLSLRGSCQWTSTTVVEPPGLYVKLGLLVNEEITADVSGQTLNIFEQETLEDYEWMWLWSGYLELVQTRRFLEDEADFVSTYFSRIDIDIRNRRKIGQSDELNLYCMFMKDTAAGSALVQIISDVRTILMSR